MRIFFNTAFLISSLAMAFGVFLPALSYGQITDDSNVRCSPYVRECIDLDVPNHGPYQLPINYTRIEKDGLKICYKSNNTSTSKANIVFAVDQSGSMDDSDKDPNFLAPLAVTEGINTINEISPASVVGYLGFANGICQGTLPSQDGNAADEGAGARLGAKGTAEADTRVLPQALNSGNHLNELLVQNQYSRSDYFFNCGSIRNYGTAYYEPFLLAKEWLDNPGLDPQNKDVIVFVTDGRPQNNDESLTNFINMVDSHDSTNFPTVYAIFIGGEYDKLKELTEKTGGSFLRLDRAEEINQALQEIIYTTILPSPPKVTTVSNNNGSSSSSAGHSETGNSGEYQLLLNNILPLSEGMNTLTITTTTEDNRTLSTKLNLNVAGNPETRTGDIEYPDIPLNGSCEEKSTLTITNISGQNISSLSANESDFIINLNTLAEVSDPNVLATTVKGDKDNLSLTQSSGGHFSRRDSVSRRTPVPLDGMIQVVGSDVIGFTWVHPEDPRDIAKVNLNVLSGPEILEAVKKPSDFKAYKELSSGNILTLPDTILVKLTEPLVLAPGADAETYKRSFIYFEGPGCADSSSRVLNILNITELENEVGYQILIDGNRNAQSIMAGDCIAINPDALLQNFVDNAEPKLVTGRDSRTNLIGSGLVQPIVGDASKSVNSLELLNQTIPVLNENFEKVDEVAHPPVLYWIPPFGITADGVVDPVQNQQCLDLDNIGQGSREFNPNCLSKVLVYSQGAYKADINIYDNLGKVVHHSSQNFGFCGEMENSDRIVPAGLISYLVWNQKDLMGKFVASGVYVWKVKYHFEDGSKQTTYYKQGIARSDAPDFKCLTQ